MKTRNSEVLKSFVDYCTANPHLRFWQALRNWSGWAFVCVSSNPPEEGDNYYDTFSFEGRDG